MSVDNYDELQTTLFDCLTQQMSELELLQSMYPKNNEIVFTDSNIIENITKFLKNKTEYLPNYIDFLLNLIVEGHKLELSINLPSFYPKNEEPDVYIRCNDLNRKQETHINSELSEFIKNNYAGEVCIFPVISWIQDYKIVEMESLSAIKELEDDKSNLQSNNIFVRLWILSHHIYNKKKREEIVKLAKEFNLCGFCLPGKPGIICIEGYDTDCKEWWNIIKTLNWKKIGIKKTDVFRESDRCKEKKFNHFEELHFQNTTKNNKQSDMSEFSKFIHQHGLTNAFNEIFGFCHSNPT